MHKKFEINRTKIKGGCQSGRKVVPHNSKNDLPLKGKDQINRIKNLLWLIIFLWGNFLCVLEVAIYVICFKLCRIVDYRIFMQAFWKLLRIVKAKITS